MKQTAIMYPVFMVVILTIIVGLEMIRLRVKAVKDGLNPAYFLLHRGGKLPDDLLKTTQHYSNLFELPILFYVVCLAIFATRSTDWIYLGLAWIFVCARYAHAYIHTTYNDLNHRWTAYLAGTTVVTLMWLKFLLQLLAQ